MFKGRVEKVSHEGGLLVSYTGACPALGSVMVDSGENYIGKVDGVIGNLNNSLVHIAHLDRQANPSNMVGLEITIRTKRPRDNNRSRDNSRGREERGGRGRNERGNRDRSRSNSRGRDGGNNRDWECSKCNNKNFAFRTECNRCGEPKGLGGRDNRRSRDGNDRRGRGGNDRRGRGGSDRRDRNERGSNRGTHSDNDWTCGECQNSNFSFRTECNRCGAPKGRGRGSSKQWSGNERRAGDRREEPQPRAGDWECPQCGKSNFAKRNECFGCGRSKRVGGPKQRGHHRKLKDPPPLHPTKYGRSKRRDR